MLKDSSFHYLLMIKLCLNVFFVKLGARCKMPDEACMKNIYK